MDPAQSFKPARLYQVSLKVIRKRDGVDNSNSAHTTIVGVILAPACYYNTQGVSTTSELLVDPRYLEVGAA